ncbi:uncharacterized protein UTRI_06484 [Ustilago trichophora]|uniref:Uncharacterized protein n=1 Tax=Ustilago trichophora TaxID=86804 RepID=A0A5C3EIR1_9BASI|nr:uncharacterized protein UTRI_06484 [Ustilago trichophora]
MATNAPPHSLSVLEPVHLMQSDSTFTASTASTPFIPSRRLDYEALWFHLNHLIQTQQPTTSELTSSSQAQLPDCVLNSLGDIVLVLNQALRTFYPLQDAHKHAILTYVHQLFAWIDSCSNVSNTLEPYSALLASRPSQAPNASVTTPSPTRRQALKLANSAQRVDPSLWTELCEHVQDARRYYTRVQQARDSKLAAVHLSTLQTHIDGFLSILKMIRIKLRHVFPNLSTASLESQDASAHIMQALDKLASGGTCSPDEAVSYLILCLPASNSSPDRSEDNPELERHFAQQLQRTYRGDAPARFLRFVNNVHRHFTKSVEGVPVFDSYLKATSIVQSSGTGKTRLVLELAKRAPLLYVCVRRKAPHQRSSVKSGFPLAEQNLFEFFRDATSDTTASCDLQVAAFIGAWFETLSSKLNEYTTAQDKYLFLVQLNDFGGPGYSQRQPFFNAVLVAARLKLVQTTTTSSSTGQTCVFSACLDTAVSDLSHQLGPVRDWLWDHHKVEYQSLGIERPPVFVAFDECVDLIVPKSGRSADDHQLNSLRRAWHHMLQLEKKQDNVTFWLLLLSTNTGAAQLIEPQDLQASARAPEKQPLPVFIGLGFDVLRSDRPRLDSPNDVSNVRHLRSYGRPLWGSLPLETFWEVAEFKLLGAKEFNANDAVLCYNLLASRLALRLVPTHHGDSALFGKQKSLITRSIDRHMRILHQVIQHTSLAIVTPSEPVLAVGAANIMLAAPSRDGESDPMPAYAKIIDTFTTQCLPTLGTDLLRGTHGEFMARFALMAAWDAVKLPLLQSEKSGPASVVARPVLLQSFLKQLATLDQQGSSVINDAIHAVCQQVRNRLFRSSQPNISAYNRNTDGNSNSDEDVGAWLNFTHFDTLPHGIRCISPDYLWYCWKRGVAIQMAHGQPGVDGIIPIFVGRLSQKFRAPDQSHLQADEVDAIDERQVARQMTYIAWEAKYRDQAMSRAEASDQARSGPTLLLAACDADLHAQMDAADSSTPLRQPLTRASLVTVIADLGTEQAFSDGRNLQPRADLVTQRDGSHTFLRLWIRGIKDPQVYPCFDVLGIRAKLTALFKTVTDTPSYEEDNKIPSIMWNSEAHPESQSHVSDGPPPSSLPWSSWSGPPADGESDYDGEPMDL